MDVVDTDKMDIVVDCLTGRITCVRYTVGVCDESTGERIGGRDVLHINFL